MFGAAHATVALCLARSSNLALLLARFCLAILFEPKVRLVLFFFVMGAAVASTMRQKGDGEVIFDAPVLDNGVRKKSSVFCAVCFQSQGSTLQALFCYF